jgi:hypothetical protein
MSILHDIDSPYKQNNASGALGIPRQLDDSAYLKTPCKDTDIDLDYSTYNTWPPKIYKYTISKHIKSSHHTTSESPATSSLSSNSSRAPSRKSPPQQGMGADDQMHTYKMVDNEPSYEPPVKSNTISFLTYLSKTRSTKI